MMAHLIQLKIFSKNIKGDEKNEILILRREKNLGKGAAIKTGLKHIKGKY
jgi:glycosyltransferase involved in cell wall biosynthesis